MCVLAPWGMTGSWEDAEPILSEVNRGHISLLEVPYPPPNPIQLSLSVVERQPADIKKGQQLLSALNPISYCLFGNRASREEAWEKEGSGVRTG